MWLSPYLFCAVVLYHLTAVNTQPHLTSLTTRSPTMFTDGYEMIPWHDVANQRIYLFNINNYANGGSAQWGQGIQSYSIAGNTFRDEGLSTDYLENWGTSFASIGDDIYYTSDSLLLQRYNIPTDSKTAPFGAMSTPVTMACVCTDGRFLFVVGGHTGSAYTTAFQVYDLIDGVWRSGPATNLARGRMTCQSHNGYIFLFGGSTGNPVSAIESIYVGSGSQVISSLSSASWTTLSITLSQGRRLLASAMCDNIDSDLVYIVGGQYVSNGWWVASPVIDIFNTSSQTLVAHSLSLNTPRSCAATICVDDYFYIFGGDSADKKPVSYNSWERSNVLYTQAPTQSPTNPPSVSPTQRPTNQPSGSPTDQPSGNPTTSPTNNPSTAPTTYQPSTSPTTFAPTTARPTPLIPTTSSPTVSPTGYPSVSPTTPRPTLSPSNLPTVSPTKQPSVSPTNLPSVSPTVSPSKVPTTSPTTPAPTIPRSINNVTATFSCSYLEIYVNIEDDLISLLSVHSDNDCSMIFDAATYNLLGTDAICSWSESLDDPLITVVLAPTSTISVTDTLVMNTGLFSYFKASQWNYLTAVLTIDRIEHQCPNQAPLINFDPPPQIGICDDLELDIRSSIISNLGGRAAANIQWDISLNNGASSLSKTNTKYVLVDAAQMTADTDMLVTLTITAWYGGVTTLTATISKQNNPIPSIQLMYPAVFDAYSNEINIESTVRFTDSCLSNTDASSSLSYVWSVRFLSQIEGSGAYDAAKFNALSSMVTSATDGALTILNNDAYLQRGASYAFSLTVNCDSSSTYECTATSSDAIILYQYSPIICQISGGNKKLTVSPDDANSLLIRLNGNEWTHDPDEQALTFAWSCSVEGVDCSQLLSAASSSITDVSFNDVNFTANGGYFLYEFTLSVLDENVLSRAVCTDSVSLELTLVNPEGQKNFIGEILSYLVYITATSTSVSVTDKLRLIGAVTYMNGTKITDDDHLFYTWSEYDQRLTEADFETYRLNQAHSKYLVLDASGLQMGATYEFVLDVYYRETMTHLGSSSTSIFVKTAPVIYDNGFSIEPFCNHTFEYFRDSLFYGYNLYVSADGDKTPLTYNFKAVLPATTDSSTNANVSNEEIVYLHSNTLYQPSLNFILLPIECNFSLLTRVTDYEGTQVTDSMGCCLDIANPNDAENDCFSYQTEIVEAYFNTYNQDNLFSNSRKYRYIFQSSFNLLHYVLSSNMDDTECKYNHFKEVMDVLHTNFADTNLCESNNYFYVIQLAQTLSKWLTVGIAYNENDGLFQTLFEEDCDYFSVIYRLLTQSLDPCGIVQYNISDTNLLSVSSDSVLTNRIIVLYDGNDITDELSTLLTNVNNLPLLYELINVYVDALNAIGDSEDVDCSSDSLDIEQQVVFLETILYISGLASISTTIPTEYINIQLGNFELLTIRDNGISTVNVTVNDIEIVLNDNNDDQGEDDDEDIDDIIVYGLSHRPQTGVAYTSSEDDCLQHEGGILGENEVSVTILNGSRNASDQNINITMRFQYDPDLFTEDGGNLSVCVWWNEIAQQWDSDGCRTQVDEANGVIICRCSHLTTFGTISNLKLDEHCEKLTEVFADDPIWAYVMLGFGFIFLLIFFWIYFNIFRLKLYGFTMKEVLKHRSMKVLALMGIVCVFQILICLIFFSYSHQFVQQADKYLTVMLIIFLLIPLMLYYIMFTFVISTWINVAHAMNKTPMVRKFKGCIKWSSVVIVTVYTLIIIALVAFQHQETAKGIINVGELGWIAIMTISIVGFSIYGARVVKLLYLTTVTVQNSKTKSAFVRITIAVIGLNLFFFIQCGLTVYFLLYPEQLTIHWRVGDLAIHAVFLAVLCYLYSEAFKNIIAGEAKLDIGSSTKKPGSMRRQHSVQSKSGKSRDSDKETSQVGSVSKPSILGMTALPPGVTRINSMSSLGSVDLKNSPKTPVTPAPKVPAFLYGQSSGDGASTDAPQAKVMADLQRRVTSTLHPGARHTNLPSSSVAGGEHVQSDSEYDAGDVIRPQTTEFVGDGADGGDTTMQRQITEFETAEPAAADDGDWEYYYEDEEYDEQYGDDASVNM